MHHDRSGFDARLTYCLICGPRPAPAAAGSPFFLRACTCLCPRQGRSTSPRGRDIDPVTALAAAVALAFGRPPASSPRRRRSRWGRAAMCIRVANRREQKWGAVAAQAARRWSEFVAFGVFVRIRVGRGSACTGTHGCTGTCTRNAVGRGSAHGSDGPAGHHAVHASGREASSGRSCPRARVGGTVEYWTLASRAFRATRASRVPESPRFGFGFRRFAGPRRTRLRRVASAVAVRACPCVPCAARGPARIPISAFR